MEFARKVYNRVRHPEQVVPMLWRARVKKEKDRLGKRKARARKNRPHGGGAPLPWGCGRRGMGEGMPRARTRRPTKKIPMNMVKW